jgi:hypothetical protein
MQQNKERALAPEECFLEVRHGIKPLFATCEAEKIKNSPKRRSGPPVSGVEGLPETGCPLDPGPGLGGTVSLGLLSAKASPFL